MRRWSIFVGLALLATVTARGQPAPAAATFPAPINVQVYRERAAQLFDPSLVSDGHSPMRTACDNLLLICQAVSVALIVAGLISKMRRDHIQMEGVAAMMLKVAFIALVPALTSRTLETADTIAGAIGYEPAATHGNSSATGTMWALVAQWAPPGSPLLDAVETQAAEQPASGDEQAWSLRAWNWAKGAGAVTSNLLDACWQSAAGATRVGMVFTACGVMVGLSTLAIILVHIAEMLRYVLFFAACAVLPVFIAGFGIDSLRAQSVRFMVWLVSVACWPIGWALTGVVTSLIGGGVVAWMSSVTATALGLGNAADVPALAVSAPYIGWATLFIFMAATVAVCLWVIGAFVYAPFAVARLVEAGAHLTGTWAESAQATIRPHIMVRPSATHSPVVPRVSIESCPPEMSVLAVPVRTHAASAVSDVRTRGTDLRPPTGYQLRSGSHLRSSTARVSKLASTVGRDQTANAVPTWLPDLRRR